MVSEGLVFSLFLLFYFFIFTSLYFFFQDSLIVFTWVLLLQCMFLHEKYVAHFFVGWHIHLHVFLA